jgi:hypothetical protein
MESGYEIGWFVLRPLKERGAGLEWRTNRGARAKQPLAIAKSGESALAGIWEETT